MGQIQTPPTPQTLILTATDRLVASNADGGMSVAASHVVLFGEAAGQNLGPLSHVYVIGAFSLDAGMVTVAKSGTVILGGLNLSALDDNIGNAGDGPSVVLGFNNFPVKRGRFGQNIVIGSNIGENFEAANSGDVSNTVIIGPDALRYQWVNDHGGFGFDDSVFIGAKVMQGFAGGASGNKVFSWRTVAIGSEAMSGAGTVGNGSTAAFNVAIGFRAGQDAASGNNTAWSNTVAIGASSADNAVNASDCVWVGAGSFGAATQDSMTLIGAGISGSYVSGSSGNTALGFGVSFSGVGGGNILIGANCNGTADLPATAAHRLLFETGVGGTRRNMLYGVLAPNAAEGGLVIGFSTAANRDLPGVNILKLLNGSANGVAPVGGGFFYSTGGDLHWVTTGNVDYALTPSGNLGTFTFATLPAAPPASSRAFITDGAAAPVFTAAAAGGGAVFTPVYFDGAAWLNG